MNSTKDFSDIERLFTEGICDDLVERYYDDFFEFERL